MAWWNYESYPRNPRRPADGIRAKTGRGQKFGQTWWGDHWIAALEQLVDPNRLQRGRSYARSGQVLNVTIAAGTVQARVQGSRPSPYVVQIELAVLTDLEWEGIFDVMAGQARFAAKLLAGDMPRNIEEAFNSAGVGLFPHTGADLRTNCNCPDWSNPCKHVAAVYYLLGEQFDEDPFLLFRLRGRDRDATMAALRERRSLGPAIGLDEPEPLQEPEIVDAQPLEDLIEQFWVVEGGFQPDAVRISAPSIDAGPVRCLGDATFWDGSRDFLPLIEGLYASVTRAALEVAFSE